MANAFVDDPLVGLCPGEEPRESNVRKLRSASFQKALTEYRAELREDPIIRTHLTTLYDNLLEQNLIRVIEPFSRVQVNAALTSALTSFHFTFTGCLFFFSS